MKEAKRHFSTAQALGAMADQFDRLPLDVANSVLDRVKHDSPKFYNRLARGVSKQFLEHFRSTATKLTLLDPAWSPALTDGTLSFCAKYKSLSVLKITTRCFHLARAAGLGSRNWNHISLIQLDVWQERDALRHGRFLLGARGRSLQSLAFQVGMATCGPEISIAIWRDIASFLELIDGKGIELSVKNAPMYSMINIPGGSAVKNLKLDMVIEMFSIAQPFVFSNLEELIILDRDSRFRLDGNAGLWQVVGDLAQDGRPFGPPWPKMENLRKLTYRAQHHDWARNGEMAVDTFRCIAMQAPNLEHARLSGMVHLNAMNRYKFHRIISCLWSLERLQHLDLNISPQGRLGDAHLTSLASLVQKDSLNTLNISGVTADQGDRLMAVKKPGLKLTVWYDLNTWA